jgi:hypothetical protein
MFVVIEQEPIGKEMSIVVIQSKQVEISLRFNGKRLKNSFVVVVVVVVLSLSKTVCNSSYNRTYNCIYKRFQIIQ